MKYKNVLLVFISIILFAYMFCFTILPSILKSSFNVQDFEKKLFDATSLKTEIESIDFKISPALQMTVTIANFSAKYIDLQDCFDAQAIILKTSPLCLLNKTFKINDLYLKNVKFSNQVLPDGNNKLAFLPGAFNSEIFGAKHITIISGPVRINGYEQKDIGPNSYNEKNRKEILYTKDDVKAFLSGFQFSHVIVR